MRERNDAAIQAATALLADFGPIAALGALAEAFGTGAAIVAEMQSQTDDGTASAWASLVPSSWVALDNALKKLAKSPAAAQADDMSGKLIWR